MAKTDHQYFKSEDSPLISVSHPSRYRGIETPSIDYSIIHAGVPKQNHNKNTVVMSNLTYEYKNQSTGGRLQPTVQKERTKNLNTFGDETGIHKIFMQKEPTARSDYYILRDREGDISDTYYLKNKPLINRRVSKPFQTYVNPDSLGIFQSDKKVPLSKELNNNNSRLTRNVNDLKEV